MRWWHGRCPGLNPTPIPPYGWCPPLPCLPPGIKLGRQYIRYAGLAVMVLVVLKVFLWDMSGLEGLYQIGSFLGLGLSLVGIGWLYQRFVQKPKEA